MKQTIDSVYVQTIKNTKLNMVYIASFCQLLWQDFVMQDASIQLCIEKMIQKDLKGHQFQAYNAFDDSVSKVGED